MLMPLFNCHDSVPLGELVPALIKGYRKQIFEQLEPELRDIAEDVTKVYVLEIGPPWTINIDGVDRHVFVRDESVDPPERQTIGPSAWSATP